MLVKGEEGPSGGAFAYEVQARPAEIPQLTPFGSYLHQFFAQRGQQLDS
jgi:hypothetical protein